MDDRDKAILEAVKRMRDLANALEMLSGGNSTNRMIRKMADDLEEIANELDD